MAKVVTIILKYSHHFSTYAMIGQWSTRSRDDVTLQPWHDISR